MAPGDPAVLLACDSVLEVDGEIVGKPGTAEVATRRWRAMAGGTGRLHTGHWVQDLRSGRTACAAAVTDLRFAELSDEEAVARATAIWESINPPKPSNFLGLQV